MVTTVQVRTITSIAATAMHKETNHRDGHIHDNRRYVNDNKHGQIAPFHLPALALNMEMVTSRPLKTALRAGGLGRVDPQTIPRFVHGSCVHEASAESHLLQMQPCEGFR